MNLFPLNKGLMWKEWRQNRWAFWLGFMILSTPIIWDTLLRMFDFWANPMPAEYQVRRWGEITDVGYNVLVGNQGFFPFIAIASIGLGGFLLSQERTWANTLDFLVGTPVSRREIIAAKYVTGLKMIGIVWGVNLAFVLLIDAICQAQTSGWWVLKYFCEQLAFLVAIYSAGHVLAVLCGNILSTAVAIIVLNVGPFMAGNFLMGISNRYVVPDVEHQAYYRMITRVSEWLSLYYYSTLRADEVNALQVICLLLVAVVCYALTLVLFEKNAMERNGRLLMFGDFWKLATFIVPFLIALIYGFEGGGVIDTPGAVIRCVIMFAILFLLMKLARRVLRSFGFR